MQHRTLQVTPYRVERAIEALCAQKSFLTHRRRTPLSGQMRQSDSSAQVRSLKQSCKVETHLPPHGSVSYRQPPLACMLAGTLISCVEALFCQCFWCHDDCHTGTQRWRMFRRMQTSWPLLLQHLPKDKQRNTTARVLYPFCNGCPASIPNKRTAWASITSALLTHDLTSPFLPGQPVLCLYACACASATTPAWLPSNVASAVAQLQTVVPAAAPHGRRTTTGKLQVRRALQRVRCERRRLRPASCAGAAPALYRLQPVIETPGSRFARVRSAIPGVAALECYASACLPHRTECTQCSCSDRQSTGCNHGIWRFHRPSRQA
jgi:hypothetical protein